MQAAEKESFIRGFRSEECVKCGKCIAGCQYMDYSPQQARRIMEKITIRPQWYSEIADCIRCGKCNHRCPKDARPGNLMYECQEEKRKGEVKFSQSMAYFINGMGAEEWGANFFKDVYKGLGSVEKNILNSWAEPKKSKDVLWVGCTDRMLPRTLESSDALQSIAKFGGPDDCCGVWAMQAGLLDEGYRIAKRLVSRFKECRFERLVVACGHCQKVFTRMMPDLLGIEMPFPIISIYEYLLEIINEGSVNVKAPLNLDVAISDPCFGYENGEKYLAATRNLAKTIGMTVSEMPHNRENALCCGYGGLFNDGKIKKVAKTSLIKRKDMAECGKKHIVSYCPGCHLVNHYFQPGYKSHYLLEDVLSAFGEKTETPYSIFYRRLIRPHIARNAARITKSAL